MYKEIKLEAFVYCWTDNKTNKLYIGSHKGSIDDGYICSSKYMLEEYKKRPNDFTRQIIAQGLTEDIRKLETKILQSSNARLDEIFYNKHDNDGLYFEGWKRGEFSDEHRKNMSIAASKRKRTPEHLAALHEGRRKSKNSIEHKNALIISRIGKHHTDESKRKMSEKKLSNPDRINIAKLAGKISAEKRKNDPTYKLLQSERAKAAWKKRKEGLVNGN